MRTMKTLTTIYTTFKTGFVAVAFLFVGACQEQTTSSAQSEATLPQEQQVTAAQSQPVSIPAAVVDTSLVDDDQRMYKIDTYTDVADSGHERGKTIFYFKCRVCHNSVADDAGPLLDKLFERPMLISGQPVNEETVTTKIRQGGPMMPGFKSLTDIDIADLFTYLRSDECCYTGLNLNPSLNPKYKADANKWPVPAGLWGGAAGEVRSVSGQLLEGIKVQLIAPNGVRMTVFTNAQGRYEFPEMQAGAYTLRIATPAPYKAYRREGVQVAGNTTLEQIVLEPIPNPMGEGFPERAGEGMLTGALPATQEILSQMSGSEILWNLPGTGQEKALFARTCGNGCHSYQQILRNRFDEQGWRAMVHRMMGYEQAGLLNRKKEYSFPNEEVDTVVKWLAKVRGPDSVDMPVRLYPRPQGASTEVVITEYEMPRRTLGIHDTSGDAQGNIWYTSHFSPYQGVLDPLTGIVKEVKTPPTRGGLPGTHTVMIDNQRGRAWYTQRWAGSYFVRLDIATGEFTEFDTIGGSNFQIAPDGSIWIRGRDKLDDQGKAILGVYRIDAESAEITDVYPLKNPQPYQSAISADGRFWAGATPPTTGANTAEMLDIRSGTMYEVNSGDRLHSGGRGGFEPNGNDAWFGGRDGVLVEVVNEIDEGKGVHIRTYVPPTPYYPFTSFYTAMPDKNGDVWAGVIHDRGFVRYSQQTGQWTVYENPEPNALSRHIWIDNRSDPVAVWYPDFHTGFIVRIQPRPVE